MIQSRMECMNSKTIQQIKRDKQKKIKVVAFDIDGTLTKGLSWERFHALVGITPEQNRQWIQEVFSGTVTHEEQATRVFEKYHNAKVIKKDLMMIAKRIHCIKGAKELIKRLQKIYTVCLVSDAPDLYVKEVARMLNIRMYHVNYWFIFSKTGRLKKIKKNHHQGKSKRKFLELITKKHNILPEQIVFVGDSMNDLDAFLYTGRGILLGEGNEELRRASWKQVHSLVEIGKILL